MADPATRIGRVDAAMTSWMSANGVLILRVSLGVVFLWFGFLKFFPGVSPAQNLAGDTIAKRLTRAPGNGADIGGLLLVLERAGPRDHRQPVERRDAVDDLLRQAIGEGSTRGIAEIRERKHHDAW